MSNTSTCRASKRFKDAMKSMDTAGEAILALKQVTFQNKHELDPRVSRSLASWPKKWKRSIPLW